MTYDWKNIKQQQLAGMNNGMQAVSEMSPSQYNSTLLPLQQPMQQQQLRTGKNPNPKFPRLRHAWEGTKEFIGGKPEGIEQYSTITPQQQGIMQLLQQLGIYNLQNPYEGFEEGIANPAYNEFNQQIVPSLAESFTAHTNGAMSSPSFASQLGQAGAGLSANLASQRSQYGQQNKQQALNMLMSLLNPQSENIHRPRQEGAGEKAIQMAMQAALKALTAGAL